MCFDEIIKQTKKSHEHLSEWASVYEALTLEGFSFPQKVDLSFKEIKNSLAFNTTEDLPDSTVGNLILGVFVTPSRMEAENNNDIDTDDSTESYSVKKLQPIADTENFAKRVLRRYRSSADIKSVSDNIQYISRLTKGF